MPKFKLRIGSRAQVMHGTAKMTGGGLTKSKLKYNKRGKIVSKKASRIAKKNNRLVKGGYVTRKGIFGIVKKGGMLTELVSNKNFNNNFKHLGLLNFQIPKSENLDRLDNGFIYNIVRMCYYDEKKAQKELQDKRSKCKPFIDKFKQLKENRYSYTAINNSKLNNSEKFKIHLNSSVKVLNIVCGLPGSGKGNIPKIMRNILKLSELSEKNSYTGVINDYVTGENGYKNGINKIKIGFLKNNIKNIRQSNNKNVGKINQDILFKISYELTKLYHNTRTENLSRKYNNDFKKALRENKKYVSHENIGDKGFESFLWLLELAKGNGYKVIITYMYIEPMINRQRLFGRFASNLNNGNEFRLPAVTELTVRNKYMNVVNTIKEVMQRIKEMRENGSNNLTLIVIDNNGKKDDPKSILIDSNNIKHFNEVCRMFDIQ